MLSQDTVTQIIQDVRLKKTDAKNGKGYCKTDIGIVFVELRDNIYIFHYGNNIDYYKIDIGYRPYVKGYELIRTENAQELEGV